MPSDRSTGNVSQASGQRTDKILSNVQKIYIAQLSSIMDDYFQAADDALYDHSDKAKSNQHRTTFFYSMQELRRKKNILTKEFLKNIADIFDLFKKGQFHYFARKDSKFELSTRQLTLMEEKELDKILAVSTCISKAKTYLSRPLLDFKKRLGVITNNSEDKLTDIPLSPNVLVNSFVKAFNVQDGITSEVYVVLVKVFERTFILKLPKIYDAVNQHFIKEGILPNLQLVANRSEQHNDEAPDEVLDQSGNVPSMPELAEQIGDIANANFSEDKNFADILMSLESNQQELVKQANKLGGNSLNMALSLLQLDQLKKLNEAHKNITANLSGGPIIDPSLLKEDVLKKLNDLNADEGESEIDKVDEVIIDMVSQLFQFVIEDKKLPKPIQDELLKLQVPYLNFAINDHAIFANTEHLARVLLEKLADSSIGWNEENDLNGKFMKQIKAVVAEIVQTDAEKVNFQELLDSFDKFLNKSKKRTKIAEKRASEKALGLERMNQAKRKTADVMEKNMHQRSIPQLIKKILLKDWVNVLTLEFLRHAENPEKIQPKIDFVTALIHAAQRNKKQKTPGSELEKLSEQLETELRSLSYNETEIKEKSSEMSDFLSMINFDINDESMFEFDEDDDLAPYKPEELSADTTAPDKEQVKETINQAIKLEPVTQYENIADSYAEQAKSLHLGSWIDMNIDGEVVRAKLSWVSPITSARLFVNSKGQKIGNLGLSELAMGLRNKTIRIIDSEPLFDRVLKAMSKNIQKD